ncbi:hypothetical protein OAP14_03980, partial [Aliiglaciecola sp.]|nr:hypothetical protein [Aliiglaciecola sp.]
ITDPAQKLYQLKGFMNDHDIPELVYANADLNLSVMESQEQKVDKYRKPMWLDLANPICLDLLKRLTQSCSHVVFREALPDESQHWLTQGEDNYVSELQFEIDVCVQQTEDQQGEAA